MYVLGKNMFLIVQEILHFWQNEKNNWIFLLRILHNMLSVFKIPTNENKTKIKRQEFEDCCIGVLFVEKDLTKGQLIKKMSIFMMQIVLWYNTFEIANIFIRYPVPMYSMPLSLWKLSHLCCWGKKICEKEIYSTDACTAYNVILKF